MALSDPLETSNDNDIVNNMSENNVEIENKNISCMVNKDDKFEILEMIEAIDATDDSSVISSGTSTSALIRATENNTIPNPNADRIKARLERRKKRVANKQKDVRIQVYSVSDNEESVNIPRRHEEDNDTSTVITAATAALTEVSSCFDDSFLLTNGDAANTSAISSILDVSDTNDIPPDNGNIFSMAVDFLLPGKAQDDNKNGERSMDGSQNIFMDEDHITNSVQDNNNEIQTVATNLTSQSTKSVKSSGSEKSEGVEIVAEMEKLMCAADSWVANALGTSNAAKLTSCTNESKWRTDANENNMTFQSAIDLDQKISPIARMRTNGGGTVSNEQSNTWDNQIQKIVNRLNDSQQQPNLLGTCESHESTDSAATEITRNTSSSRKSKPTSTKLSNFTASKKILEENHAALIANCHEQGDDILKQLGIAEMIKNMFSADGGGSCAAALANKQIYSDEDNEDNDSYSDDESSGYYDDESTHASTISEGSDESNSNRSSRSKSTKYSDSDNEDNDNILERKRHLMTQPPPPPPLPPKFTSMSSSSSVHSSSSSKQRQHASQTKNDRVENSRMFKHAGEDSRLSSKGSQRNDGSGKQNNKKKKGGLGSAQDDEIFVEEFIEEIVHNGISMTWHKVQTQSYQRPKQVTASIEIGTCGSGTFSEPKLRWKVERAPNSIETEPYMKVDLFDIVAVEKAGVMNFHSYPFAIPSNSFFVSLSSGGSVLFEAKNPKEQQRIIRGLSQVISRLTYNLIAGDIDICWDLFACSDNSHNDVIESDNLTVEELDLWYISKAMNDVTHKLVDKSALQAKGVDEV